MYHMLLCFWDCFYMEPNPYDVVWLAALVKDKWIDSDRIFVNKEPSRKIGGKHVQQPPQLLRSGTSDYSDIKNAAGLHLIPVFFSASSWVSFCWIGKWIITHFNGWSGNHCDLFREVNCISPSASPIVKSTFRGGCPSSPPARRKSHHIFRIFSKTMFQKLIHVFFSKSRSIQLSYENNPGCFGYIVDEMLKYYPLILGINIKKLSHNPPKKNNHHLGWSEKLRKSWVILPYQVVIYHEYKPCRWWQSILPTSTWWVYRDIFPLENPPQELEADVCRDSGTGGFFGRQKTPRFGFCYPMFLGDLRVKDLTPRNRINEERLKVIVAILVGKPTIKDWKYDVDCKMSS